MVFTPNRVEFEFTYQGETFKAVSDMEMIARFEERTGRSMLKVMDMGDDIPLFLLGEILLAALAENHPDLTRAHAMAMVVDPAAQEVIGAGLRAGLPQVGDTGPDAGEGAEGNARKPRARRKTDKSKGSAGKTG